jgi:hypothetical protein
MKASTLIIIALLCAVAFLLLPPGGAGKKPWDRAAQTAAQPRSSQSSQRLPPTLVPQPSLVVVRGTVATVSADGMFVECDKSSNARRPAVLDNPKFVREAREEELSQWGPLLVYQNGMMRNSDWEPAESVIGRLLLKEHPLQSQFHPGDRVKIIAAPLNETYSLDSTQLRTYTARFTIVAGSADAGRNWMWQQKQRTLLDH